MADVLITVGIDPKVDYSDFKRCQRPCSRHKRQYKTGKIKVELDDTSVAKIKQELSTIHQLAATASKGGVGPPLPLKSPLRPQWRGLLMPKSVQLKQI